MPVPVRFLAEQANQLWLTVLCGQMSLTEVRAREKARLQAMETPVTGRNQVWLVDFAHFYLDHHGGEISRITGVADYWSRYEFSWHVAPAWQRGATDAALARAVYEAEKLEGGLLFDRLSRDPSTGELVTIKVIARSVLGFCDRRFARYVASFPEFDLIRTWGEDREPGLLGERGFEALQSERFSSGVAPDESTLAKAAAEFRDEFNARPHAALSQHSPIDVHLGYAAGIAVGQ